MTWEDKWAMMPIKIVALRLVMVEYVFMTSTQVGLCEFKASLVYLVSSRVAKALFKKKKLKMWSSYRHPRRCALARVTLSYPRDVVTLSLLLSLRG